MSVVHEDGSVTLTAGEAKGMWLVLAEAGAFLPLFTADEKRLRRAEAAYARQNAVMALLPPVPYGDRLDDALAAIAERA